jgi:hypothetical protein
LGLAIAVMVLSFGHSATTDTEAATEGTKTEMDLVISGTLASFGDTTCSSATVSKCNLAIGSPFLVQVVPSVIPVGGYNGFATLLTYGSLLYKPTSTSAGELAFDESFLPLRSPELPTGKEGTVGHGDVSGLFPPLTTSTQKTALVTVNMNCAQNAGGTFSDVIALVDGNATPAGSGFILGDGLTTVVPNVGSMNINCSTEPTATPVPPTATPTNTPLPTDTPSSPSVIKGPTLQNLFLTAQGTKIPPTSCLAGTDGAVLSVDLSTKATGTNKQGEPVTLGGFQFEVNYPEDKVCVQIFPGSVPVAGGWDCMIDDSVSKPSLQGSASIVCVSEGKDPISPPPSNNLNIANVVVQPMEEEYSVMRPTNGNGNVVQIINKGCKLTDTQGNPIASPVGAANCTDADITIRYLEGDVVPDCVVNALDTQASAFRWGSQKGTLLYNDFYNLEPFKPQSDDDIDVNDLQFVYGRFGSDCANPHPAQDPVNPKTP